MSSPRWTLILALCVALAPAPAAAASKLSVQATLRTAGGAPVSGTHDITFRLFPGETGGAAVWQQQVTGVTVQDGLLDVELGPFTVEPFASNPTLWLEAQVGTEVLPRRPLHAVARALVADQAASATVAAGLSCTGCVGGTAIPSGAIAATHLQDGAVTSAKAGFPWALGDAPGGAAKDLACTGCVATGDLGANLTLKGDTTNTGALALCTTPYSGCGLGVGDAAVRDTGNGWLTVLSANGLRVRDTANGAHRPLELGGGTSYGAFTVTGGHLSVTSGKLGVGTTAPTQAADVRGALVTTGGLMGGFWATGSTGYHPDATLYLRDTGWWLGVVAAGETPWDDQDSFVWNTVPSGRHFAWTAGGVSNPLMLLTTDGRLGVGTTSPAQKVDVAGTVKALSVQVGNDTGACNGGRAGTLRWSGTSVQVCDGSAWADLGGGSSGGSQQSAALSCEDILKGGGSVGDGVYWIDPNGGSTADAFQVWCDMTRDGGGWTLVHKTDKSGSGDRTDGGYNTGALTSPAINGVAVLPRATMASLGQVVRVESADGKTLFWSGAPYYTTDAHEATSYTLLTAVNSYEPLVPGVWAKNGAHSLCVAWTSAGFSEKHICGQRWCCGAPNAGLWFNGGGWPAGYYAGAVWVRKTWIPPAEASGDGTSPSAPGKSCAQLLADGHSTGDKAYWLDPTGGSTSDAFQAWCDMTTDGGGWTLVHKTNRGNTSDRTDAGANVGALATASVDAVAVLPRATMKLLGDTIRIESTGGYKMYWKGVPYYTTDSHDPATSVQASLTWGAWGTGVFAKNGAHGPCISANPSNPWGTPHTCTQRWCCGGGNEGLWFNGSPWSAGYYAGRAWVK